MTDLRAGKESRPSVAALSLAQIKEIRKRTIGHKDPKGELKAAERGNSALLSFAQERLWFLDSLGIVGSAYNIHMALRAHGELDPKILERCLKTIVQRHEPLRTRFEKRQGVPLQVIDAEVDATISFEDLSQLNDADQAGTLKLRSLSQAQRHLEISKGQVFVASLLRLTDRKHVFLLTLHHIVADGWSLAILNRELSVLYNAYIKGDQNPLPPLPFQYADYAIWQRDAAHSHELESQLSYWKSQLSGMVEELALPTDYTRPETPTFRGDVVDVETSTDLRQRLERVARQEGATLYMCLLAAFSVLLSRYCRQREVSIGCSVAGRTQPQLESLVGMFVNTLVLRIDLSGRPSFRELLRRVKEVTLGAYAHQDLPLERLVNELKPERTLAKQPLFQVTLSLQDQPKDPLRMEGIRWENDDHPQVTAQFDLSLRLVETPEGLTGGIEYATDLFERQTIQRMSGHWRTLLVRLAQDPSAPVDDLPMMKSDEWSRVVKQFNATAAPYPRESPIHRLFESKAAEIPNALAVEGEGKAFTFSEVNAAANRLASVLLDFGVVAGDRVAILTDRSTECLIGILGSLKVGAAYVPLDPAAPEERLTMVVADSAPRVLLLTRRSALGDLLSKLRLQTIIVDAEKLRNSPDKNQGISDDAGASRGIAYVIYTSGSTGVPKGVAVEHRQVASLWKALEPLYKTGAAGQRVGINAPLFFDASVKQWLQLLSGRTVVLIPQAIRGDPGAFLEFLETNCIDAVDCTPYQLSGLISAGLLDRSCAYPRIILVGGEPVDKALWGRLRLCRDKTFFNVYGPTECTVDSCCVEISSSTPNPTIGSPMQNSQIYILDESAKPVPTGIVGEIHIAGSRVAREYLGRPALTAQRFIADPFSSECGARMYRSGDLGRWKEDGTIEFFGRNDDQVKIRGHRIEVGEVEAHLGSFPGLEESAVSVASDSTGSRRLVGHIVPKWPSVEEREALLQAIPEYLAARLPEYMIPTQWIVQDELPITRNGKLDRRALAASVGAVQRLPPAPPETELEWTLSEIWCVVLRIEKLGIDDNFFELGGHSLMGAQLATKVSERCHVTASTILVFQAPTVRRMAKAIQKLQAGGYDSGTNTIVIEEGSL